MPELENFDYMLYRLSECDISKVSSIEEMDVCLVTEWYYMLLVKDLNELNHNVAELERLKK